MPSKREALGTGPRGTQPSLPSKQPPTTQRAFADPPIGRPVRYQFNLSDRLMLNNAQKESYPGVIKRTFPSSNPVLPTGGKGRVPGKPLPSSHDTGAGAAQPMASTPAHQAFAAPPSHKTPFPIRPDGQRPRSPSQGAKLLKRKMAESGMVNPYVTNRARAATQTDRQRPPSIIRALGVRAKFFDESFNI